MNNIETKAKEKKRGADQPLLNYFINMFTKMNTKKLKVILLVHVFIF